MLHRRNMRNLSFTEMQLSNNFHRYRKLAELQAQLIKNDLINNRLVSQIQELREQNLKLRTKIQEKEIINNNINIKNNRINAFDKAASYLDNTNISTVQALKQKCKRLQESSYHELSNKVTRYFHRPKENSFGAIGHNELKLSKNVYISKQPLKERHISFDNTQNRGIEETKKIENNQQTFAKNRSITQGHIKFASKDLEISKFPSNVNGFQGKKAQSRFLECQEVQQEQNEFNRWKSEDDFGFKSELLGNLKSGDIRKRKTFLSIVSVSSKQNKKNKQN